MANDSTNGRSDDEVLWRAQAKDLAFRKGPPRSPDLVAPLWPAPFRNENDEGPHRLAVRMAAELDHAVSDDASPIYDSVVDEIVQGLGAENQQWLIRIKEQHDVFRELLQQLKNLADESAELAPLTQEWPTLASVERSLRESVWLDAGQAFASALLDDLFDVDSEAEHGVVTTGQWAESTWRHLDVERFRAVSGLPESDVAWMDLKHLMDRAASFAVRAFHIEVAPMGAVEEERVLRYRDRWLAISTIKPEAAACIQIATLRPALAIFPRTPDPDPADDPSPGYLVAFGRTEVGHHPSKLETSTTWDHADHLATMTLQTKNLEPVLPIVDEGVLRVNMELEHSSIGSNPLIRHYGGLRTFDRATVVFDRVENTARSTPIASNDRWYLAVYAVDDEPGTIAQIADLLGEERMSIVAAMGKTLGGRGFLSFLVAAETDVSENEVHRKLVPQTPGPELLLTQTPYQAPSRSVTSPGDGSLWNVALEGPDRPGLLLTVISTIEGFGGVVWRYSSQSRSVNHADGDASPSVELIMTIELPEGVRIDRLRHSLRAALRRPEHLGTSQATEAGVLIRTGWTASILDYWAEAPTNSPTTEPPTIVVVNGSPHTGLEHHVLDTIHEEEYNIVASASAILGEFWTGIYAVSASGEDRDAQLEKSIRERAEAQKLEMFGLHLVAGGRQDATSDRYPRFELRFEPTDRFGALAKSLASFNRMSWNVESLHTHLEEGVNPSIGVVRMVLAILDADVPEWEDMRDRLDQLADEHQWISYEMDAHPDPRAWHWSGPRIGPRPTENQGQPRVSSSGPSASL